VCDGWLDFCGEWGFVVDDVDEGFVGCWLVEVVFFGWLIIVLYLLEFKLLGVGDWMVYFVVWYCCEVDFDCFVDGWCVLLYFGVVDYEVSVWVNG